MRKTSRRFVVGMLSCLLCLCALPTQAFASSFSDVDSSSPYYSYIDYLSTNDYMVGYASSGLFGPDDALTRADAVVTLYRIHGLADDNLSTIDPNSYATSNDTGFKDVEVKAYYTSSVNALYKLRSIVGYDGTTSFLPNSAITREELVTMIARLSDYCYPSDEITDTEGGALARCADADEASSWAEEALSWALDVGILTASNTESESYVNPTDCLTRAEATTMLSAYGDFLGTYYSRVCSTD
jgi:hypothetical protein